MSGITHGMDVGQVQALAAQMQTSAGEIEAIIAKLSGMLQNTAWLGADRSQFESDWNGQYTQQLRTVAEALKSAGQRATAEAQAQEQASAT